MAPDVKRIAKAYVRQQLANMDGKPPARRAVNAAVRKVAAVIQEIRTAAATHQAKPKAS